MTQRALTIDEMRKLREKNATYQQIADKAGISRQRVHAMLTYSPEYLASRRRDYRKRKQAKK